MTASRRLRALDLGLLILGAPLWVPVMVVCALAVAIGSGRPVFFRQERVGRDGVPFQVLKFRSMRVADGLEQPTAATITRVGALLRRTSLDELPQLLNVLRGDMSLVGPRPMLPRQVAALSTAQAVRHDVRPGLTGLAQVSGRNSIPWVERLAIDVAWATTASIRGYLSIVAKTFAVIATGSGVDGNDADDPFVRLVYQQDEVEEPLAPVLVLDAAPVPRREQVAA